MVSVPALATADRTDGTTSSPGFGEEVAADHGGGSGLWKRRRPNEKVVGGDGQGVLVGAAVDVLAQQLLGRGVDDGSDRHVRGSQTADVINGSGNAEVSQQDSPLDLVVYVREKDVGGFDVAVQQTLLVGIVQG